MNQQKPKRMRLSIDLEKHPDIKADFLRAKRRFPLITKTEWTLSALRRSKQSGEFGKRVPAHAGPRRVKSSRKAKRA